MWLRRDQFGPASGLMGAPWQMGVSWYVRKQYIDLAVRYSIATVTFLFTAAASTTLEVFKWTHQTDHVAVLDEAPDVQLFGQQHTEIFPFALILLPVYVGAPAIHGALLYLGWLRGSLDDTSFSMRWGYLLDPFERKFWFWSVVISVRKLVFVVCRIFLRNAPYFQTFVPAACVALNMIANYWLRPYRVERHNLLENVLLLCLLCFILLGLLNPLDIVLYHDEVGREDPGPYDFLVFVGVATTMVVSLVASAVVIYADVIDAQLTTPRLVALVWRFMSGPLFATLFVLQGTARLALAGARAVAARARKLLARNRYLEEEEEEEGGLRPPTPPRGRRKKKHMNPRMFNREAGDPPHITGNRFADILFGAVKAMKDARFRRATALKAEAEDDDELVHPDDGRAPPARPSECVCV